mgnify:CR=1 FL=1
MKITAYENIFGRQEHLTSDKLRQILSLIDDYMHNTPYDILDIHEDDSCDPNGRIDIKIRFARNEKVIEQKLLILKGELIDGETFHKRFSEWYGSDATDEAV